MLRKQEKQYQVNIERKCGGVMGGMFDGGMKRPQVNKKQTITFQILSLCSTTRSPCQTNMCF